VLAIADLQGVAGFERVRMLGHGQVLSGVGGEHDEVLRAAANCQQSKMSVIERGDAVRAEPFRERDERSVDEPNAQVAFDARDLERLAQRVRPPPHLVCPALEVLPHPGRHEAPGTTLHHVIHLGEGKRRGDEVVVDLEDPPLDVVVFRLVGDDQRDHD
jgi:hypothetical protein